jgi:hypothetical protein
MYEPTTVEIDRNYGDSTYRSQYIKFTGHLVKLIKKGPTTMRLYEWVDRGRLVYLIHVREEEKPSRRLPRHTLYPFINTHLARATPKIAYAFSRASRIQEDFTS